MSAAPEQLLLRLRLRADATFANYVAGAANAPALHALRTWLEQPEGGIFYLFGAPGCGRSHLLQAACHLQATTAPVYLPLADFATAAPAALLESLELAALLCLDDIDTVLTDPDWCEALFHLCNRVFAAGHKLLVSASVAPAQLDCHLADLRSRLSWGGSFRLHALDDAGRGEFLQLRARERGFELNAEVVAYILNRHSRDPVLLLRLLDELDRQSLAQKKRITVPFVRQIIDA